jgi:hypothetical protein
MTDLIERIGAQSNGDTALDDALWRTGDRPPPAPTGSARPGAVLLAVLLGCSAIDLFVTAAPQFGTWRTGAIALVIAAWAQLTLGVTGLVKPSVSLSTAVAGVNVVVGSLWAVVLSGHHAPSTFAGGVGVALSGAALVVAAVLALRPALGAAWPSSSFVMASIVPVAVVVVTMTALSVPATVHAAAAARATKTATTIPDPFLNAKPVPGQSTAKLLQSNDSEKAELKPYAALDTQTQTLLSQQLAQSEQAAMRFPTVADAKAAGMVLAGGMAPGVGAHYQMLSAASLLGVNPDGSVNASEPASWIYSGTADNDPVVGVMYESLTAARPSGFAGPNDHWHQHSNLCIVFKPGFISVPFDPDSSVTPSECSDVHGQFLKKTVWMVHAWVVPGWESPQGVFSHANYHVYCPGNTDLTDAIGFCQRQS